MENASKAILIAGGILVSMIVISIFYYMFGKTGILVSDTSGNTLEQQIADVNKGFEAFNKKVMYGIDVINVLNKAIDNNKRNDCEFDGNDEYNVNITIKLKEQFSDIKETYKYDKEKLEYKKTSEKIEHNMNKKEYELNDTNDYDMLNKVLIQGATFQDADGNIQQNLGIVDDRKTRS